MGLGHFWDTSGTLVIVYNIINRTLVHLNSIFLELLKYIYMYMYTVSRKKIFSTGSGYMRVYKCPKCTEGAVPS